MINETQITFRDKNKRFATHYIKAGLLTLEQAAEVAKKRMLRMNKMNRLLLKNGAIITVMHVERGVVDGRIITIETVEV